MKNGMIWGVSGGIGRALAEEMKRQEWNTIGVCRQPEQVTGLVDFCYEADVANDYAVQTAVMNASYEVDSIQLWIYAAGDIIVDKADSMSPEAWTQIINANLTGAFQAYHRSVPLLAEDAHIVFLGAVSERLMLPKFGAYVAAKAGLEAFATSLAKENRKQRVTVVRPGAVATPFWEKLPLRQPKDAASPEKVAKRILEAHADGFSGQLDLT